MEYRINFGNKQYRRVLDGLLPTEQKSQAVDIDAGVFAISDTLAAFKVNATVTGVKCGPTMTRYEITPARGVGVKKIANMEADLCRAMTASSIRIEAPVRGTSFVGIEVPNKQREKVVLRDIVGTPEFENAESKLTFALGKDVMGKPMITDLAVMPHLLIAGATNSGKSVFLNSLITSIAMRAKLEEVRICIIDPKRVELIQFNYLPHLIVPVVVEVSEALTLLDMTIAQMESRYKLFAEFRVRNVTEYNAIDGVKKMARIVLVIDELADLMMTSEGGAEKKICRLAQLARATGIHLVVATQRPSVNVLTGVIKSNFPSRIAFALPSHYDSSTILETKGAEKLIGSGDMLFMPQGGVPVRVQGSYTSDADIEHMLNVCYTELTPQ